MLITFSTVIIKVSDLQYFLRYAEFNRYHY
nr:MAG TPA: hypothetical protein [Crassvirales sp.]